MNGGENMAKSNKLSIYLIKDEFSKNDAHIVENVSNKLLEIDGVGNVYYIPSNINTPKWIDSFFCGKIDSKTLFTSNVRVVMIARIKIDPEDKEKTFALTWGYGKYLLNDDVVEDDFGLKVVLNTITPDGLRRINKTNIGGNQKVSNEQLPKTSDINGFGFDIDRDIIGTVTGRSEDDEFAKGIITGGDLLSMTASVDINDIVIFLQKIYDRYVSEKYRENFEWVDHIKKVKDSRLITKLGEELIRLINESSPNIWMAVPDVIDWEDIKGFRYTKENNIYDDIYIDIVKSTFTDGLYEIAQLKEKRIAAISALDDSREYAAWTAYRCLYGELEYEDKSYCINNGKWYRIDKSFVEDINKAYESISISDMDFINYSKSHSSENDYTVDFVSKNESDFLCMDKQVITYGGGHSKIELCDIRTADNKYIHIKPYSSSSTLSHLFNQAVVSAELVLGDNEFRIKANEKIKQLTSDDAFLVSTNPRPEIVLAIISDKKETRPNIPFFSKVTIKYAKQRLETLGCTMTIKNIFNEKKQKD